MVSSFLHHPHRECFQIRKFLSSPSISLTSYFYYYFFLPSPILFSVVVMLFANWLDLPRRKKIERKKREKTQEAHEFLNGPNRFQSRPFEREPTVRGTLCCLLNGKNVFPRTWTDTITSVFFFFRIFIFFFFFTSSFLFYCVGIAISKDYLEIFDRNHMKEIFVRIRLTLTPPGTAIRELWEGLNFFRSSRSTDYQSCEMLAITWQT
jgi:hypothetical protein